MGQPKQKTSATFSRHEEKLKIVAVVVFVYAILLFVPFINGFTWYPIAVAKCGNLPIITNDFAAAWSYTVPGDALYGGPNIFTKPNNYYCSIGEAEAAGYNPYVWGPERCKTGTNDGKQYCVGKDDSNWVVTLLALGVIAAAAHYYFKRRPMRHNNPSAHASSR